MIKILPGAIENTVNDAMTWGRSVRVTMVDGRKFVLVPRGQVEPGDITRIARAINDGRTAQRLGFGQEPETAPDPATTLSPELIEPPGRASREAKDLLVHYFHHLFTYVGTDWGRDNEVEIESIVDHIIDAARGR